MGYDLARATTIYANKDDQDWLASDHGVTAADSITLDSTACATAWPSLEVPSGAHIGKQANGTYRPFLAVNTTDTDRGFLLHGVKINSTAVNVVAAIHWHGEVVTARVPLGVGQTVPLAASVPFIRLV